MQKNNLFYDNINTINVRVFTLEDNNTSDNNKKSRSGSSEERLMDVYDYSDTVWLFEEGMQNKLYFMPSNISEYATTITGFEVSNESAVWYGWDYELETPRIWFQPKEVGITNVTIYVKNDNRERGSVTFKIKTTPYQSPVANNIDTQHITKYDTISFSVNDLLKNGNNIWAQIIKVSSNNPDIVTIDIGDTGRYLDIYGLSTGDTIVTAHIRNVSSLGQDDIVDVSFPVTVTDSVYGE